MKPGAVGKWEQVSTHYRFQQEIQMSDQLHALVTLFRWQIPSPYTLGGLWSRHNILTSNLSLLDPCPLIQLEVVQVSVYLTL
jgi:hypothetical protein